ncbi:MAG: hypothetical protein LUG99_16160, partial [Lachnospiraceae bacterium]|nr:hypothetical protein [Lachnospiraceae bacterium]
MYSKALATADRNLDRMMIDELREQTEQHVAELAKKDQALADSINVIRKLQEEIRLLKSGQVFFFHPRESLEFDTRPIRKDRQWAGIGLLFPMLSQESSLRNRHHSTHFDISPASFTDWLFAILRGKSAQERRASQ